jgi:TolA-binding protein
MKLFTPLIVFVSIVCAGCSKPTPEEDFAKVEDASQRAAKMMDTVRNQESTYAIYKPVAGAFEDFIREHPHHPLAEAALFRVANIRNNHLREFQAAVDAYEQYCGRYPDGKQRELSMFLIGYLYNNELHNLDSAGAAYRRFLAAYPESQYATSAQFELNTLGKSPEDLLPKPEEPRKPAPKRSAQKTAL